MNIKCLAKIKSDDIDLIKSKKPKKPIKLSKVTPISEIGTVESNEINLDKNVIDQVGQLTRNFHDSLRELGYDKRLEKIASEVPEAQDKLAYVANKTQQAADRALTATEIAMPIQDKLSADAIKLSERWKGALESQQTNSNAEAFKVLLIDTLSYLDRIPEQTRATNEQLLEIMMAQDFQDLTGQVIKKIIHMVQDLEKDLVGLLLTHTPSKKSNIDVGLMNGPVTNTRNVSDVVSSQDQVDDLLASLGF
ncbi:chemotaxis protein CheZ [Nitrosomonas sp. PY1]|uniref:protein phosphatase CheZ n=1 Tax=Nitrosomonas sp. PY1 TaxID=1803906 RepID=UPI001FC873BA|nr:protein phosphatase CheZ [Nitrosomonas sp. PY1]GKS69219.1 chemotaxis protein CheZ [Nitrosomonas sp. PY1]